MDLGYTLQLSAKIRRFAVENEVVVKYEELKHFLREQRLEAQGKNSFLLAFKTDRPFRDQLQGYFEQRLETRKRSSKKPEMM